MNNMLGSFVKEHREKEGLSLREFGKLCGISHTHIDSIEKGVDFRTGKPVRVTNETLEKLSRVLDVSESYLLTLSLNKTAGVPQKEPTQEGELYIPDELKDLPLAFYKGGVEALTQDEIDKLVEIAKIIKSEAKKHNNKQGE